jgi:hypothetical protein
MVWVRTSRASECSQPRDGAASGRRERARTARQARLRHGARAAHNVAARRRPSHNRVIVPLFEHLKLEKLNRSAQSGE